ncbi:uncharacterized protein PgNI_04577 [Pyricularia grisea]|uniref:Uncharacterized protein n=1 Tax=Pyricularia grisea TaxID=148305 RepID=A0A6P8BD74_PYRGI|nr:uncharacterized protein PgNI_04577 [Pyricularia grisea]TLD13622.1 hypothetical protein PgNI_04577 [Pyricularia grisea]
MPSEFAHIVGSVGLDAHLLTGTLPGKAGLDEHPDGHISQHCQPTSCPVAPRVVVDNFSRAWKVGLESCYWLRHTG